MNDLISEIDEDIIPQMEEPYETIARKREMDKQIFIETLRDIAHLEGLWNKPLLTDAVVDKLIELYMVRGQVYRSLTK